VRFRRLSAGPLGVEGEDRVTNRLLIVLLLVSVVGCTTSQPSDSENPVAAASTAKVSFAGGHGADCADAVVIRGAKNESEGVKAEYEWIAREYPGSTRAGQGMGNCKTIMDVVDITTSDGSKKRIYFDISSFFGKW
jgi:hypothetical protein